LKQFKKKKRVRKPKPAAVEEKSEKSAASLMFSATLIDEEVDVDPKKFGILIGPGGATLNKLQDACMVRINVPERDSAKRTVTISGESKDAIAKAKNEIKSLLTKGFSLALDPSMTSSQISVPPSKIGFLIGDKGKNIKLIEEQFQVKVNTPARNSENPKMTIIGNKENVQNVKSAKEVIKCLIEQGFSTLTHPGWTSQEVPFPPEEFRTLIGPGGTTIKSIKANNECEINIPSPGNPNQNVIVVGLAINVARCAKTISGLLARREASAEAAEAAAAYDSEDDYQ